MDELVRVLNIQHIPLYHKMMACCLHWSTNALRDSFKVRLSNMITIHCPSSQSISDTNIYKCRSISTWNNDSTELYQRTFIYQPTTPQIQLSSHPFLDKHTNLMKMITIKPITLRSSGSTLKTQGKEPSIPIYTWKLEKMITTFH